MGTSGGISIIQLKKLDYFIKRRREIASIYREKLDDKIKHPSENAEKKQVYSRYIIRTPYNPSVIIEKMGDGILGCNASEGIDGVTVGDYEEKYHLTYTLFNRRGCASRS
ncbi:MAG: DegT/DnrJ/EryC1/StrS family aminotransferase [Halobacteriota archaeon]